MPLSSSAALSYARAACTAVGKLPKCSCLPLPPLVPLTVAPLVLLLLSQMWACQGVGVVCGSTGTQCVWQYTGSDTTQLGRIMQCTSFRLADAEDKPQLLTPGASLESFTSSQGRLSGCTCDT